MVRRVFLIFFAAAVVLIGAPGCHTVHGAGEDVSNAGEAIQDITPR